MFAGEPKLPNQLLSREKGAAGLKIACAVVLALLVTLLLATPVHAYTGSLNITGHTDGGQGFCAFSSGDKTVFCASAGYDGPEIGTTYTQWEYVGYASYDFACDAHSVAWLVAHLGEQNFARPTQASQLAIWVITNGMTNINWDTGIYERGTKGDAHYMTGNIYEGRGGRVDRADTPKILALLSEARNYAGQVGPWDTAARIWYRTTSNVQNMLEILPGGAISLKKTSANPSISEGNSCYSLAGAEYGVYTNAACTSTVGTITTGADGCGQLSNLVVGYYYVKETKAPKGYALDENVYQVTVESGKTAVVHGNAAGDTVSDTPQNNPVDLVVQKVDRESGGTTGLGKGSLADAEFTVKYYAADPSKTYTSVAQLPEASRTWVLKTDAEGKAYLNAEYLVSGDAFFTDTAGAIALPIGVISVQETKAPKGYLLSDASVKFASITGSGAQETLASFVAPSVDSPTVKEQVIRGDLEFSKVDGISMETLAGVPFRLTSMTTGETHVLVGDENGEVKTQNSWNMHSSNTNANDAAVDAEGNVDEAALDDRAGVWFSGSADMQTVPDVSKGALPYDTYKVEELRCSANEKYNLVTFYVVISRNNVVVDRGTVDDHSDEEPPEEPETPEPEAPDEPEPEAPDEPKPETPEPETPNAPEEVRELPQTGLDTIAPAASALFGAGIILATLKYLL